MNQKTYELRNSASSAENSNTADDCFSLTDWWRKISGFDLVVIAGGAINLIIVVLLLGYWLLYA